MIYNRKVKYSMKLFEVAGLLAPIGCGPLASRTPINIGVPCVGIATPCAAVSIHGTTVLVPEVLEL